MIRKKERKRERLEKEGREKEKKTGRKRERAKLVMSINFPIARLNNIQGRLMTISMLRRFGSPVRRHQKKIANKNCRKRGEPQIQREEPAVRTSHITQFLEKGKSLFPYLATRTKSDRGKIGLQRRAKIRIFHFFGLFNFERKRSI